ncbi:quinolinate synthase NadA [Helicobacter cappadocius]|uniref:Quinolinate synthase n=1 Tax=Helicobacter cappadocius TaxID=3063998 RepID=A0AA90PR52_9HELI|nr:MULTISPECIES: quinolinate synthase NadA [unclassified Helicobacter]MDO7253484.1 quinolinate synthase NadA [Helicobacter sp. faydin-H75]MDP2539411.1 quinolinate synthase NadA [Helicobacter sp. faydin-H76]
MQETKKKIKQLLGELDGLLVAHFYQKDDIVEIADITGDSLELAKRASESKKKLIIFCGVGFMGQSVKILAPQKDVIMPKIACCSMARMISSEYYDKSIELFEDYGIKKETLLPITYINSNAEVKAKVGKMDGLVCTSSNAKKIFDFARNKGKKIFFLPDKCLGENLAKVNDLNSAILGQDSREKVLNADVVCYNGFCSVHQLFTPSDVDFFREKYPDILIVVHPECRPDVVEKADFVGSTSQIIAYVNSLPLDQKVAVGTEFNLVNRLRSPIDGKQNTFVLSSTIPECPTMNETTLKDIVDVLQAYKNQSAYNEISIDDEISKFAKKALDKMLELS